MTSSETESTPDGAVPVDPGPVDPGADDPSMILQAGFVHHDAGRLTDAVGFYRRALALAPDFPGLRNRLGATLILLEQDREEALALLDAATVAEPNDPNPWINLTTQRLKNLDLVGALAAGARAVELAPTSAMAAGNYSLALKDAGRWEEADALAARAAAIDPRDLKYRFGKGILDLVQGRYDAGWPAFEVRWDGSGELSGKRPVLPGPTWRGEPLAGKTLLVWGEQGMGDVLQFCRYVPLLADYVHARGGALVWNTFPQMGGLLFRTLGQRPDICVQGGLPSLPPFDYEFSMLSIPHLLSTREDAVPGPAPYLRADPRAAARWKNWFGRDPRLKVGLAWTGSATHQRNPFRAVGLARMAAAFGGVREAAFYSLQQGAGADIAAARAQGFDVVDHTAEFSTFDDTAAFVDGLDVVITVCTSIAHLSGALGKPTWILLDRNPHWVWGLERTDSPWYPAATLYRQTRFADWSGPLKAVTRDLRGLARGR